MNLAGSVTAEVGKYLEHRRTVLVPIGSLEQHGEAAPLACDTILPVRLCAAAGEITGTAVAPAITFGHSPNHMAFPGTVTLRASTLSALVRDVAESLCSHGFRSVLFVSGHGGNREPVEEGLRAARDSCAGADLRYIPYWSLPGIQELQKRVFCPDPGYHVTVTEVSMVWSLMGMEMPDFPRRAYPPEPSPGERLSAAQWRERYPDGGAGSDLTLVSPEKGARLFEAMVRSLCGLIEDIERHAP